MNYYVEHTKSCVLNIVIKFAVALNLKEEQQYCGYAHKWHRCYSHHNFFLYLILKQKHFFNLNYKMASLSYSYIHW